MSSISEKVESFEQEKDEGGLGYESWKTEPRLLWRGRIVAINVGKETQLEVFV